MPTLRFRNALGEWEALSGAAYLDDLTDVDTVTTAPIANAPLAWNATLAQWVPGTVLGFPNTLGPKINTYADTFGIGIASGSQVYYASATHRFRTGTTAGGDGTTTGTEIAAFDASGIHPRTSVNAPMSNSWTGTVNYTVNPATVTCDIDATCPVAATGSYWYQFAGIPAGVSGPRATITMHTKAMGTNYGAGLDCWVEARSGGVGVIFPGVNDGTQKAPPGTRIYTTLTWAR